MCNIQHFFFAFQLMMPSSWMLMSQLVKFGLFTLELSESMNQLITRPNSVIQKIILGYYFSWKSKSHSYPN